MNLADVAKATVGTNCTERTVEIDVAMAIAGVAIAAWAATRGWAGVLFAAILVAGAALAIKAEFGDRER